MIHQRFTRLFTAVMLVTALVAGAGRPADAFLDKTRFLAHIGVAYFAFHHWVLKPYQQGSFQNGAPHRTSSVVKAGVALLFAYHEAKVSQRIAQKSNDPLLRKLDAALGGFMGSLSNIGTKMRSGHFNPADIGALNSQASDVQSQAASGGYMIKDVPAAVPGT